MLEMQQARMGTDDLFSLQPILLPVDAGAVRARRKLDQLIRAERDVASLSGSVGNSRAPV